MLARPSNRPRARTDDACTLLLTCSCAGVNERGRDNMMDMKVEAAAAETAEADGVQQEEGPRRRDSFDDATRMDTEDEDNASAAIRHNAGVHTVAAHAAHVTMQMLAHLALHIAH